MGSCHLPCATCPWRVDSVGGVAIPGFDIEKARRLRNTVGDGDAIRPIMACHGSPEGVEVACRGYVAVEGYTNLAVRLAAAHGRVDLVAIIEACTEVDLFDSFDEMLEALEDVEADRG